MILGSVYLTETAIVTHRDSFLIAPLSAVSVRRPLLAGGLSLGGGLLGFCVMSIDLLHFSEILFILALSAIFIGFGVKVGQLRLLSRDLRGSELANIIWGDYATLNQIRLKVATRLGEQQAKTGKRAQKNKESEL